MLPLLGASPRLPAAAAAAAAVAHPPRPPTHPSARPQVKEVAAAGPEGEAPAGYTYDPATGYWANAGALRLRP